MRTKNLLLLTLFLMTQALYASGQECKGLTDGKYLFKHKTKGHSNADFLLTIDGDSYTLTRKGQEEQRGSIIWWPDNCMFKLNSDEKEETKISNSDDVLTKTWKSYGGGCYELTDDRKFRMTYCGNLHITINEGRIIKR